MFLSMCVCQVGSFYYSNILSDFCILSQLAAERYVGISPMIVNLSSSIHFCFKIVISSWVEDFFQNVPIYLW